MEKLIFIDGLRRYKVALCIIIVSLLIPTVCGGASFMPVVTNYQARDYHAQLQNWDAAQLPGGLMCFANSDGILTFDGYSWKLITMPGNHITRSLLADGGRLYAGSFEEFGFFQKGDNGEFEYHSLSKNLPQRMMNDDEFWSILKIGSKIYFQSFEKIFSYETTDGHVSVLPRATGGSHPGREVRPLYIFNHRGTLLMQNINGGIFRLANGGWEEVFGSSQLKDKAVGIAGDIIATENGGLMKIKSGHLLPHPTDIDSQLAKFRINRLGRTKKGNLLIGTIGDGIYMLSEEGKLIWHLSREEGGLCNNSVLGLFPDNFGNIWAMLDDGISLIHTASPYTMLRPDATQADIGMVYDIGRMPDGRLIAAANQGAYIFNGASGRNGAFSLIDGSKGQTWCVRTFDTQTFIGGNEHSIELTSDGSRIFPGATTDMKRGTINGQDILLQSSYYDLNLYKLQSGGVKWVKNNHISGFGAPILQIEIDSDGSIWASHLTRGIIRLRLTKDLRSVKESNFYPSLSGDTVPSKAYVMKIRGSVVFADDKQFYTYNETSDRFIPFKELNTQLSWISQARSATQTDDQTFWISTAHSYHLIRFEHGKYKNILTIPLDNFSRKVNGVNCRVFADSTGRAYFNLNGGIGRVDLAQSMTMNRFHPELDISSVGYMSRTNDFVPLNKSIDGSERPEAKDANFHIVLSYPEFDHSLLHYRFTLKGNGENIVKTTNVPEINYPRLGSGNYTLLCEVLDENEDSLGKLEYSFSVPRPWPLSWWAICSYLVLILLAGYVVAKFYARRRLEKERRLRLQEKAAQDREIHRQQLVIAEQQKRLLEQELTEKGKELASMALDAYSRQQVIEQLRESLRDARSKGSAATFRSLSTHLQSLSANEGNGGEFWSIFEKNFDLIHEHFFRNLRQKYPQLTATDLRVCALMRLNLSTKDMARFQGMTVRGVETARYRLRKKLGLSSDVNITEFMIDFSGEEE